MSAIKLVNKESLYAISDLNADTIIKMSDDQLADYQETLTNAVNIFPVQRSHLENAFAKMDYAPALQWLKSMRNTLNQINADNLVKNCDKHLALYQDIDNIKHDRFKTYVDFTMATLALLYEDIKKVLEESAPEETAAPQVNFAKRIRERLATIAELNEDTINKMKDDQLKTYIKALANFPEDSISQVEGLKGAFKMKNYPSVMRWLGVLEGALTQIHANALADECRKQINLNNEYSAIRHEKLELFINYILSSISILCEDIGTLKLGG
ncbi:MAG: hypothetical protein FWC16_10510 [Defluviitaleaceae bacterium]|nr:hypothetical protein [Defluviitaleaceae bacterium]MCL2275348.1 hypothetical protein [Defluviitaleaceae bacterium]